MPAAEVRTGDQVVYSNGATRTVTHARIRSGVAVLSHGVHMTVSTPPHTLMRVLRSTRKVVS